MDELFGVGLSIIYSSGVRPVCTRRTIRTNLIWESALLALYLSASNAKEMGETVERLGDAASDQAALAMVRRSDPLPQPPPLVADEGLNFTLPVIFRVKGKS
jgi:hypothetical protein